MVVPTVCDVYLVEARGSVALLLCRHSRGSVALLPCRYSGGSAALLPSFCVDIREVQPHSSRPSVSTFASFMLGLSRIGYLSMKSWTRAHVI